MTGLTDIHCHALYGVDDGAHDIEESLDMLSVMYDEGIRNVILTPHYHGGYMTAGADRVRRHFEALCAAAGQYEDISQMRLYLGNEIYYYPSVPEWIEEGKVMTLAGSDYVLAEFGFTMDKRMIFEGVTALAGAGYIPLIAHVERYSGLSYDPKNVEELIRRGAFIQINAEALFGRHKVKSFVKKLLSRGMVHFLATDAHDSKDRAPILSDAIQYITKHYGEDYCRDLVKGNPEKILANEYMN